MEHAIIAAAAATADAEETVFDRECKRMCNELSNLANLLDVLADRMAPVLLSTPRIEDEAEKEQTSISPLCSQIHVWGDRTANVSKCVNKLLSELEL